jgi:hypothetical protein
MDLPKLIAQLTEQAGEINRLRGALSGQASDHQGSTCPCCARSPVSGPTWSLLTKQDERIKGLRDEKAAMAGLLSECLEAMIDYAPEQCDPGIQHADLRAKLCKAAGVKDPWDALGMDWVRDQEGEG